MARQKIERKLSDEERSRLFVKLVQPNMKLIKSTVAKYTKNQSNLDDNIQDVCERILQYIDTYDPEKDLNVWIITVAVRMTGIAEAKHPQSVNRDKNKDGKMSYIEKYEPKNKITYQSLDDISTDDFVDQTPHFTEVESYSDAMQDALMNLEPKYARAFLFRHAWGRSYKDIAEMESIPENTAKGRVFKAKERLHEMISKSDKI